MNTTDWHPWARVGLILLLTAGRYLFERWLSRLLKGQGAERTSVRIFVQSLAMIVFNIVVLLAFGLLAFDLVTLTNLDRGLVIIAVGLAAALMIALLSYLAVKAGHGKGYEALLAKSRLDQALSLATFLLLAGPAEDLFFIGFAQNLLMAHLGWVSILAYMLLFTLYHLANVVSGVENKRDFLGALPVRLLVAFLLGGSFYFTKSLIYGFVIHNAVDTFSYLGLLLAVKQTHKRDSSAG